MTPSTLFSMNLTFWTRLVVTFSIVGCFITAHSQISYKKGAPPSYKSKNLSKEISKSEIPTLDLPRLNNQQQREKADSFKNQECKSCEKEYWGKGIDSDINLLKSGKKFNYKKGQVWVYRIHSETAHNLQVIFNKFNLPKGAEVYVYNKQKSHRIGPFTAVNNNSNKKLSLQPLPGNEIIIEYYKPRSVRTKASINIGTVVHGFRKVYESSGPYGSSGDCNVDVNCAIPPVFEQEVSAVGLIFIYDCSNNYVSICSGSLLNNTKQDGTPYFLTANHCIGSTCPSNWVFLFNHEPPQCADADDEAYSRFSDQTISGATVLSSGATSTSSSDYALMELSNTPPPSYNICYAGWDKRGNTPPFAFGIHHPSGDVKKYSYEPDLDSIFYNSSGGYWGDNYWMAIWPGPDGLGITEGGSSGSPLFNDEGQVIGQLLGGDLNDCNILPDTSGYGKFSESWSEGSFGTWLDSIGTGQDTLDTYCPYSYCDVLRLVNDSSGCISDGSGASNYRNTSNCRWRIQPPNNKKIKLTFKSFDTEKDHDTVFIYDGKFETSARLGAFSGDTVTGPVISTNDTVYIQFVSDIATTAQGWEICYCTAPHVLVTKGKDTICQGGSTQLKAYGGESYSWQPDSGLSCTNCATPTASPDKDISYQVIAKNGNNCYDTSSVMVHVNECIGIDNQKQGKQKLTLQPNPNDGQFLLRMSTAFIDPPISIKVINIRGKVMYSSTVRTSHSSFSKKIDLQESAVGLYFLKVNTQHTSFVRKVKVMN